MRQRGGESRAGRFAMVAAALLTGAAPASASAGGIPVAGSAGACATAFADTYGARHMEMGGGIALRPDGRFRYELAYGALDEEAGGHWTCDDATVYLTSDPVKAPRFLLLGTGPAPQGQLRITLDLPKGFSRQYFSLLLRNADGAVEQRDFAEDGLTVAFTPGARPLAIRPVLPVYEFAGEPIALPPGEGIEVRLRFIANDLGKVAFAHTPLRREGAGLALTRFGETIRFERIAPAP